MSHRPYLISKRNNLFYDSLEPGELPHVWDSDKQVWKRVPVTCKDLLHAAPVTDEEAHLFMEIGGKKNLAR